VGSDACHRADLRAEITIDAAGRLDHMGAAAGGEVADRVGRAGATAEAAVDAGIEIDDIRHVRVTAFWPGPASSHPRRYSLPTAWVARSSSSAKKVRISSICSPLSMPRICSA